VPVIIKLFEISQNFGGIHGRIQVEGGNFVSGELGQEVDEGCLSDGSGADGDDGPREGDTLESEGEGRAGVERGARTSVPVRRERQKSRRRREEEGALPSTSSMGFKKLCSKIKSSFFGFEQPFLEITLRPTCKNFGFIE
jgi:hypothetical protein